MSVRVAVLFLMALGATASPMAYGQQVHKCLVDGKPVYQQEPCASGGSQLRVFAGGGNAQAPGAQRPAATPTPTERAPETRAAVPRTARTSDLEREADMCLNWYRERLRDPRSAYYVDPSKDGRVLSIYVKATNGFGGYVTKLAKCEVKDGVIDNDWTRIHANRNQW